MKLTARDVLDILRQFELAGSADVPRHIERLKSLESSQANTIVSCVFRKTAYFVVIDETAEDDADYIADQLDNPDGSLVFNPIADIETYALPWHSKDVYVWRVESQKQRLDGLVAAENPGKSRSTWQKLIKNGQVKVNGKVITQASYNVLPGSKVEVVDQETLDFSDESLPIVFEDDNVIVVNKPAGILTHAKGEISEEFTVADFFARVSSHGSETNRPGIVHRLDRDTSGVMIGAKNDETALLLKKQFSQRRVKKSYIAIIEGTPEQSTGTIRVPIGRNPSAPSTFRADPKGKSAETEYQVLATANGQSLVLLKPLTGRTHQLRVHMQFIGTPIVGDRVYGKAGDRLYLHAHSLEITIPTSDRRVFTVDLPSEFLKNFPDVQL